MLSLVRELCALPGVSSFEEEVRANIRDRVAPYADETRVDALGNLIVFKRGKRSGGPKLALCAHMDEVGLIIRRITDEGYLKFSCVGGIDTRVLIGKPVRVGPEKIPGVIGLKAYHLVSGEEEKTLPKTEDLYIDIGADSKEEAEKQVALGDCSVFDSDSETFGSGLIKAKALDDRIGCAVMIKLLEEELPMDCTFLFTVQEEVGCRGAFGAAFGEKPEIALVLETTTAADLPGAKGHQSVCALGGGPVVPFMDLGSVADRELFELLRDLAQANQIPWQTKHRLAGGNDASAVQRSRGGVRTVTISAPVRYLHAPASVACIQDIENILTLSRLFIGALAGRG
ncbi:M42 family peptidase [Pseudoflavonifractor sp. 524-17]|uniref:M42 family metallopeptidase n=1 Tax=Pseudoflavonifractor sp. 524-17 TaxID=2304577 RepID=UPI001379B888|nr:M42 family metallopeptidase [Pseudoflavonifractor sp. 524-17]NCE65225.1 M42 family peptidase [Pseudoflavonifractor sp. 524-17]